MTINERDLCTALADCIASLDYIDRHHPNLQGYAMRGVRLDKAIELIARCRGEGTECVYDEFSAGTPVQDAAMMEAEAAYWKNQYEVEAIVDRIIKQDQAEYLEQEQECC